MKSIADNAPTHAKTFSSRNDERRTIINTNMIAKAGINIHNQKL